MARRAGFIRALREEGKEFLLVDSGDFSGSRGAQGRVQSQTLLEGMGIMGYHAVALGERELSFGRAFIDSLIESASFPLLAANVRDAISGERIGSPYEIVEIAGRRVGVVGLVMKATRVDTSELRIEDPIQRARQIVPEARDECDYVIVLAHLGWGGAFSLAQQVEGIDVIVTGHGSHQTKTPKRIGNTLLVQAGNQGQKIGALKIRGSIKKGEYDGRLVSLSKEIPEDPELLELSRQYKSRIREMYSMSDQWSRDAPETKRILQEYAGVDQCKSCHMEIFDRWLQTRHAHAMAALKEKGAEFNPVCVRCHATGFKKPGGFISMKVNPDLANVQCEQCHGPGSLHIRVKQQGDEGVSPTLGSVALERAKNYGKTRITVCLQCHTPERDDDFSYREGDLTGIH